MSFKIPVGDVNGGGCSSIDVGGTRRRGRVLLIMVSLSRVYAAHALATHVLLSSNQADTRGARDASVHLCGHVRGAGSTNCTGRDD